MILSPGAQDREDEEKGCSGFLLVISGTNTEKWCSVEKKNLGFKFQVSDFTLCPMPQAMKLALHSDFMGPDVRFWKAAFLQQWGCAPYFFRVSKLLSMSSLRTQQIYWKWKLLMKSYILKGSGLAKTAGLNIKTLPIHLKPSASRLWLYICVISQAKNTSFGVKQTWNWILDLPSVVVRGASS